MISCEMDLQRIGVMSTFIVPYGGVTRILDLGCGDHLLVGLLHGYTQYLPVDRCQFPDFAGEDRRSSIIDLNKEPEMIAAFGRVHYAFCSGILEYINNLPQLLHAIGVVADNIIMSYPTVPHLSDDLLKERESLGMANHCSIEEISEMLTNELYQIDTVAYILPGRPEEVIITASHPGVWRKAFSNGCVMRVPINEWRFMYDKETWDRFQKADPGSKDPLLRMA